MKRKLLLVTLTLLMIGVVSGCGRKPMTEEERFAAELNNYFEEEAEKYEKEKVEREKKKAENEEIMETFKTYDVSTEWNKLNSKVTGVQIDDKVYYAGMTFEEAKNALESSDANYEYELNPEQLVTAHEEVRILIKRESVDWFYICFVNVWDEIKTLSEIPVAWVYRSSDASDDCYKYFGCSTDEILALKYEEIENFIIELYDNKDELDIKTYDKKYKDEDCIAYMVRIEYQEETVAKEGLWTGYNIFIKNPITIYLSKATSKVVGYTIEPSYYYGLARYPMSKEISDYEHQMNEFLEVGLEELKTNNPDISIEDASVVGAYIGLQDEFTYSFYYMGVILKLNVDNTTKYTLVAFTPNCEEMDAFGNLIYEDITTHDLCDSFEEAFSNAEVTEENIVSKNF